MRSPTPSRRLVGALLAIMFLGACANSPPEVPLGPDGQPSFSDRLSESQIEAVVRYTREVLG